jgi:hypothetical protein
MGVICGKGFMIFPDPRSSVLIRGKLLPFPDHPITRDHPIFLCVPVFLCVLCG